MPLGMEVRLGPGDILLDGDPFPRKRYTASNFCPMSIVAKRLPISATAEHLFYVFTARRIRSAHVSFVSEMGIGWVNAWIGLGWVRSFMSKVDAVMITMFSYLNI